MKENKFFNPGEFKNKIRLLPAMTSSAKRLGWNIEYINDMEAWNIYKKQEKRENQLKILIDGN